VRTQAIVRRVEAQEIRMEVEAMLSRLADLSPRTVQRGLLEVHRKAMRLERLEAREKVA
jgi:hypothetical protein